MSRGGLPRNTQGTTTDHSAQSDVSGGLCTACERVWVLIAERLAPPLQRLAQQRLRLLSCSSMPRLFRVHIDGAECARMLTTERLAQPFQRLAQQRLSFGEVALEGEDKKNGLLACSPPYVCECGVLSFVLQQGSQHSKSPFKKTTNLRYMYYPPVSDCMGPQLRMYAGLPRPRPWC